MISWLCSKGISPEINWTVFCGCSPPLPPLRLHKTSCLPPADRRRMASPRASVHPLGKSTRAHRKLGLVQSASRTEYLHLWGRCVAAEFESVLEARRLAGGGSFPRNARSSRERGGSRVTGAAGIWRRLF